MRTREAIEAQSQAYNEEDSPLSAIQATQGTTALILEVLLDIRDLLIPVETRQIMHVVTDEQER